MTKIRWLKPDNMVDRDDEVIDATGELYLIMHFADFVNTHPIALMRDRGWLHIVNTGVELLIWDADRWMPLLAAGIPEVKWVAQIKKEVNLNGN